MSAITGPHKHVLNHDHVHTAPIATLETNFMAEDLIKNAEDADQLVQFMRENPLYEQYLNTVGRKTLATVMDVAIRKGSLPVIEALLKMDPSLAKKSGGKGAYIIQAAYKSVDVVRIFRENGADINQSFSLDYSGASASALYVSSLRKLNDITKYLLLHGALLYTQPRDCRLSVLQFSSNVNQEQISAIVGQLGHIDEVIGEIKEEYLGYNHALGCVKLELGNDLGLLVMSYISPDIQLHEPFLSKIGERV
jgi:hypothetical protein